LTIRVHAASRADVAKLAGVSPATVSLVLNDKGDQARVAKETQRRVLEAARELRYVPNSAARAFRGGRHLTIGIIARRHPATMHVSVFEDFVVAVIERAALHRHNVKFLPPVTEGEDYDVVGALRDAQVDGILVHSLDWLALSLADWRVPIVYVGLGEEPGSGLSERVKVAVVDESAGTRAVARHLLERNHDRVAVLAGPNHKPGPVPRLQAFTEEVAGGARLVRQVRTADWSPEGGYEAMKGLLASGSGTTAVHAGNDWIALGAMRAAHEAGIRIPEDIEVVGFGDFRMSAYLQPSLTTVRWPLSELGTRAVDLLLAQLNEQDPEQADGGSGNVVLPAELVVRASTAGEPV